MEGPGGSLRLASRTRAARGSKGTRGGASKGGRCSSRGGDRDDWLSAAERPVHFYLPQWHSLHSMVCRFLFLLRLC